MAEENETSPVSMCLGPAALVWALSHVPSCPSCPGDPGGTTLHVIFLTSCRCGDWSRTPLCSKDLEKYLEAVLGNPGRCRSWLAHTAGTGADLLHSEFLPSEGLPKGTNSDLQLTEMGGQSSSTASQPFTPYIPLLRHLLSNFWCKRGQEQWL